MGQVHPVESDRKRANGNGADRAEREADAATITSYNPATGEPIGEVPVQGEALY